MIEAARDPARELEVLELVLADRHVLGLVEQDVGGLQHGIVEDADVDAVGVLLGLVLELRHALEVAEPRDAVEHPRELGVLGHHRLQEQQRPLGVDAEREQVDDHLVDPARHVLGRVRLRDRVVVDDAIDRALVLVLQCDPVTNRTQVVAEVKLARRLDPGENRFHGVSVYLSCMRRALLFIAVTAVAGVAGGACVANDPPPVNWGYGQYGYGYGYGPMGPRASVGEPSAEYVSGLPPEPLYEQVPAAPGDGYVWIDGYWHWNGDEWVWVGGRWEQQQDGYVYVEPYYNEVDGSYIYTPGYWRSGANLPSGWIVQRGAGDRRPPVVRPPKTYVPSQGHISPHPIYGGEGGRLPPPVDVPPVERRGPSPYGPVAPSTGVNQPDGPESYGPPPVETRPPPPREQPPPEAREQPPPEAREPVAPPREEPPIYSREPPPRYVPPPSAPPVERPPVVHGPPPAAPPVQHAPPPPAQHAPPPVHATGGRR